MDKIGEEQEVDDKACANVVIITGEEDGDDDWTTEPSLGEKVEIVESSQLLRYFAVSFVTAWTKRQEFPRLQIPWIQYLQVATPTPISKEGEEGVGGEEGEEDDDDDDAKAGFGECICCWWARLELLDKGILGEFTMAEMRELLVTFVNGRGAGDDDWL